MPSFSCAKCGRSLGLFRGDVYICTNKQACGKVICYFCAKGFQLEITGLTCPDCGNRLERS